MKATIKVVTAEKEFTYDQKQILRRVTMVLKEHDLSVAIFIKEKKITQLKIKNICEKEISQELSRINDLAKFQRQKLIYQTRRKKI
jgi:hypothetical protein